jgi:hypothetical protein
VVEGRHRVAGVRYARGTCTESGIRNFKIRIGVSQGYNGVFRCTDEFFAAFQLRSDGKNRYVQKGREIAVVGQTEEEISFAAFA